MTEYIPTCADGSINTILSKNKKYEKEEGCSISNKELQAFFYQINIKRGVLLQHVIKM